MSQRVEEGTADPEILALDWEIKNEFNRGALHDFNEDWQLPQLLWEHVSTPSSLCTLTYSNWSTLVFEVNTWELHQATVIPGFLNGIGEKGGHSLRDLKINVTTAQEAYNLRYLGQL